MGSQFKLSAASEEQLIMDEEFIMSVPYCNAVGSLMYGMIGTRPDLAYPVVLVRRFMNNPIKPHWNAVKWILKYIRGSTGLSLVFRKCTDFRIYGFCDSDYAADLDRRRSLSGYTFLSGGCAISWKSSLQKVVVLSTTESEYISLTEAAKEASWLKGLIGEFGDPQDKVEIFCDSQSALALAKNNVFHERKKHIEVKMHFIRDMITGGELQVSKVHTSENPADIFTKVLPVSKFKQLLGLLNVSED